MMGNDIINFHYRLDALSRHLNAEAYSLKEEYRELLLTCDVGRLLNDDESKNLIKWLYSVNRTIEQLYDVASNIEKLDCALRCRLFACK